MISLAHATTERWPRGWYFVAFGESLARGEVRPVQLFGAEWALFRTRAGVVGMLNPTCVHLGANLARTGRVCGERLRCALHAWEFEVDGRCTEAPRVKPIPKAARQTALTVAERLGSVWAWYGEGDPAPFLDVASLETDRFANFRGEVHEAHTDCRTAMEHASDSYHFRYNHGIHVLHEWTPLVEDGTDYRFRWKMRPEEEAHPVFRWARSVGRVDFAGPCTSIYRVLETEERPEDPHAAILLSVTPVATGTTLLAWRVLVRKPFGRALLRPLGRLVTEAAYRYFRFNVFQDIEVIQTMTRLERPLWVAADGSSVRHYRGFYDRNLIDTPSAWRA